VSAIPFIAESLLFAALLFAAMIALQEWGRRLGERDRRLDPQWDKASRSAAEGAVFGLLGLFLAFTFSGAGSRFDERRKLIVEEANAIGTAWLRLDVLPADQQPELRRLVRAYVDARLELVGTRGTGQLTAAAAKVAGLQQQVWSAAIAAANRSDRIPPSTVLLPALNAMFDIATARMEAARRHPPLVVFLVMALLSLVGALFAGYGMAAHPRRSWIHTFGFALVMTLAFYVTLELEYPRLGVVRIDAADQVLVTVRESME
jgi:hypothetical protein